MGLEKLWMVDDMESDSSGKPIYELNVESVEKTTSSTEQKFQDKTAVSYNAEDAEKYQVNRPTRDIIYAKIVKQEYRKPCITSQETKTTE
jgi:uncharacterized protein YgiM (DUF1202 family)